MPAVVLVMPPWKIGGLWSLLETVGREKAAPPLLRMLCPGCFLGRHTSCVPWFECAGSDRVQAGRPSLGFEVKR